MTIQSQTTRVDYTGNGATTNFPVPFYWLQDTDLLVIRTDNAYTPPTVATLALTTDYVVTGSGNQSGGSITTTVAPTATQKLSILRNVPFTQLTHYVPNDPFPAASHEQALDKLTMETQQLNEGLSRSITLPPNATGLSTSLPLPVASQLIGWNPTATALQNVDPTTIATSVVYGNAVGDKFSGDGTTVNFNLSANPGGINNLDVSISGVTQRPGIDYTWTTGTTLTFTTAPPSGTNNILVRYAQALPIGSLGVGQVTNTNLAASAVKDINVDPAAGIQATKLAYQLPGSGTVLRDISGVLQRGVSLFDFIPLNLQSGILDGTINPATTDLTPYFSAMTTWLAAKTYKPAILWPPGFYPYAASTLSVGMSNATHFPLGDVRLHYTGTDNAVTLDGGASSGGLYNFKFGSNIKFIIEGMAGSKNACYARAILQGSHIGVQVHGAGASYAGLRVEFAVSAKFDVVVSNNTQGYTWLSRPAYGVYLTQRNAGELTSWCTFGTPILEGVSSACAYLDQAFGNTFRGGTMEGSGSVGALLTANAFINIFDDIDYEVNTDHDIYCLGHENIIRDCGTNNKITFDGTANKNSVRGGSHQSVNLTASTFDNKLLDFTYNRNGGGGAITDSSGTAPNFKNYRCGVQDAQKPNTIENLPAGTYAVAVGTSPFTYTNTSHNAQMVLVTGTNITEIRLTHGGTDTTGVAVSTFLPLAPGDALKVTYTAATPGMVVVTQ